jgi:hypothetical protein
MDSWECGVLRKTVGALVLRPPMKRSAVAESLRNSAVRFKLVESQSSCTVWKILHFITSFRRFQLHPLHLQLTCQDRVLFVWLAMPEVLKLWGAVSPLGDASWLYEGHIYFEWNMGSR